mmetsp:Transcript_5042/g.10064  ORF Transcript_5042/g.10064 Transcript_5042/m.10064 type:complete len:299 (+) Transcript_5042:285-1181(+)|eukprot:CAMPEP_0181307360 /NCGR_PEP_ID=MMETSP1101-20121128/10836_1 /TAXON_ID=46948 /ORGANISM="Rhodomonas abbreviata, Strain Caron Lab Isolate" /LENGTH=298 /DNA_ID=CAMNT_0023413567 /DNA_START=281 /DNA_END=1174 /DNA_ORIENTATION=-
MGFLLSAVSPPSLVDPDCFVKDVEFNEKNAFGDQYRNYENSARQAIVEENYRKSHTLCTVARVDALHKKWIQNLGDHGELTCMEVLELLDTLVDESDPDVDIPNSLHAYMTAERIRQAYPEEKWDWFWLTGLLHDLGKVMSVWKEEQWCVVGDTFPVGCKFSDKCVFPDFFKENPDSKHEVYSTEQGIYEPHCGLDKLTMSFGHDEYMFQVLKNHPTCSLPDDGLSMVRFHSFYPWHTHGAYTHLVTQQEQEVLLPWIREFNKFDLYSKGDDLPDVNALKPFYQALMEKYGIGGKLLW